MSSESSSDDDDVDSVAPIAVGDYEEPSLFDSRVRAQRHNEEARVPLVRRWLLSSFLYVSALALMVAGVVEIISAETERQHGWVLGVCHVLHDFSHNDSMCIYFGVTTPDHPGVTLCAVPGSIASGTAFTEPPACHGVEVTPSVEYWRGVKPTLDVECLVPAARHYAVNVATCVSSTTSGHGVASVVWRTWIERLVYLVRTPREGAAAIEAVTSVRTRTGVALLVTGTLLFVWLTVCVCRFCAPDLPVPRASRRRHAHRMAAAKMY